MVAVSVMAGSGNHAGDNGDRELKRQKPFHDFLGVSLAGSDAAAAVTVARISIASDLGPERHNLMHLEGVPFYGPRSDGSQQHLTNDRSAGSYKRSNSDSAYMGQDGFDRARSMCRGGLGGDQPRRPSDEEIFHGPKALRPTSTSQALPHPTHTKNDGYSTKWDQTVPMNVARNVQYPSYMLPFMHQISPNTFRDAATCPAVISPTAADEGSRNGIKGSELVNSIKPSMVCDENNPKPRPRISGPSGALVAGSKFKPGALISEPEAPISGDRQTGSLANRQMTIFYGGHAHVLDDVHPDKADVIMALAGASGGSWSSTVSAKSSTGKVKEGSNPTGEFETGTASDTDLPGKPSTAGSSIHEFRSKDQASTLAGADQVGEDATNPAPVK